jgi:hypothetical protein
MLGSVSLFVAMLVQKPKHVNTPDRASEITKSMPILLGLAIRRIDLDREFFASVLHGSRQGTARRKIIVVFGLEEENRSARFADCADHQSLDFGRVFPALSSACRINCGGGTSRMPVPSCMSLPTCWITGDDSAPLRNQLRRTQDGAVFPCNFGFLHVVRVDGVVQRHSLDTTTNCGRLPPSVPSFSNLSKCPISTRSTVNVINAR